ncbi:unnamed protein product [Lymnaea stagnalis]|uniref:AAA+ ATPase domain-containing protein n=1 Tax=Lymnaea stagnalis TaxID=6523 RepID=A0AAV2HVD6_LYMST
MAQIAIYEDIYSSEALCIYVHIILKNLRKYKTGYFGNEDNLKLCVRNVLLNKVIESGSSVNLSNSKLSKVYGITHVIITDCKTHSCVKNGIVTINTSIYIDSLQSEDFYNLKVNSAPVILCGVSQEVQQLCNYFKFNKSTLLNRPLGVLLHGPPGCGKTYLGQYLSQLCDGALIKIDGSDLFHPEYGSGALALKKLFNGAIVLSNEGPVVIFFDELDAICPRYENASLGNKQITAALITEMDYLHEKNIAQIFVVGATNTISSVNTALRRPGRFDKEVLINVPTKEQRTTILEELTVSLNMTKDNGAEAVSLSEIALWTAGYVISDLKTLCDEALTHAFDTNFNQAINTVIKRSDFLHALHKVIPTLRKNIGSVVDLQPVDWEDIGGLEEVKTEIRQSLEWPLLYPNALKRMDVTATKGILLYGPPGCCKTTLVRAAATSCHVTFLSLNGAQIYSPYVGESERLLSETFQKARALSPCILFFDEIESLIGKRSSGSGQSRVQERILATLLNEMDGIGASLDQKMDASIVHNHGDDEPTNKSQIINESSRIIVIGATNRPDMLDGAILRPGRLDKLIYVPPPNELSRRAILQIQTSCIPNNGLDLLELSKKTEFFSGADLKNLCKEAGLICLRLGLWQENKAIVTQEHFLKALDIVKPSLSEQILKQYCKEM